jgi:hypothetical protein
MTHQYNQHFSMKRWLKLVALYWAGNRKRYLLSLPAMLGLLAIWEGFLVIMNRFNPLDDGMQAETYYMGLVVVGSLSASTAFSDLGSKSKGIAWLAIPASALEKLLCTLLFAVLVFFVVYNVVFYLVDIPMVGLGNQLIEQEHRVWTGGYPIQPDSVFNVLKGMPGDGLDRNLHIYLSFFFMVQSGFLLGSVYFERFAFVKTIVVVLLCILFFAILEERVIGATLPQGWGHALFSEWMSNRDTIRVKAVRLPPLASILLVGLLVCGTPLVLWVATYFRIKEKEV